MLELSWAQFRSYFSQKYVSRDRTTQSSHSILILVFWLQHEICAVLYKKWYGMVQRRNTPQRQKKVWYWRRGRSGTTSRAAQGELLSDKVRMILAVQANGEYDNSTIIAEDQQLRRIWRLGSKRLLWGVTVGQVLLFSCDVMQNQGAFDCTTSAVVCYRHLLHLQAQ